ELEKSLQNYQKALDLVEELEDEKDKSNGKMVTFYCIGCVYIELAQWKDAQKYLEDSLKESVKLGDDLQKVDTLSSISIIYLQLNKPKIAIEKMFQSIQAYHEALKVRTLKDFPTDYAKSQFNLGNTFRIFAEVENTPENCEKAILAYHEALKVYTLESFPMDYAGTQNNIGIAYFHLAEVENEAENCEKAIQAYHKALKVRTLKDFPWNYAMTQNNLGNAYHTLARFESRVENCTKSIQACHEALKVYTLENYFMQYATVQNTLGNAYNTLA
ncbi:unnamed protein product, partial [marine sediment metagenome]